MKTSIRGLVQTRGRLAEQGLALIQAAERAGREMNASEIAAFDQIKARKKRVDDLIADHALMSEDHPRRAGGGEFVSLGEFLHAVRFRPGDPRLQFVETAGAGGVTGLRAELRTGDGASGGFAIPPQFRATLLKLDPQQAIFRSRAQVIPAGSPPDAPVIIPALDQSGAAPANFFGGVQVQWIGEGQTKPETDMRLREITLTPHEVAGTITITDRLLRNWQAAEALLEQQLRGAIGAAEDGAFLGGNGVAKPLGLLNAGATYKVPRTIANSVVYDDLVEMLARCYGSGIFVYSRSVLTTLMKLRDPQGRYIWATSARDGEPSTLLGRPAIQSDRNPQLGQRGDIWLADLSQYLIKDGSGPYVAASEHVLFSQNKTVIKVFWNVDGSPWLTVPFNLESGGTASPFVALDVPAV